MKTIAIVLSSFFFTLTGTAQETEKNEIQTLKIAFITNALNLSPESAQKFWPIYNKYESLGKELQTEMNCTVYDRMDDLGTMKEKASEELLKNYLELRDKEQALRKAYVSELKTIISAREIMQLKKAEYDFHKKLLQEYRAGNQSGK
ncbi:MAG TPA: hypothetical protein VFM82_02855 [Flavobacteriaceae bacterium]|nr:hypothetical protein [Flavobacteriaceae bacterium]